jgi:DNA processing protein
LRGSLTPALGAQAVKVSPDKPDPLLDALAGDPVSIDALQARTGWPTSELMARLLELELAGQIARLPGGLYQRRWQG